jgi:hypothetical protein
VITTLAGNGVPAFGGDGGPAIAASLSSPSGVAAGPNGDLIVADADNHRVRRIDANGNISTIAGTGGVYFPAGLVLDAAGNLFIADMGNHRIRRVDAVSGIITTVAGSGTYAFGGDGGPATAASLFSPVNVAFASAGTSSSWTVRTAASGASTL